MPEHPRTVDYATALARLAPLQSVPLAVHELQGEQVWLRHAARDHWGMRRRLLGWIARTARLPMLNPPPLADARTTIAGELARLQAFSICGIRVPQVLASGGEAYVMSDLRGGLPGAPSLQQEIETAIAAGSDAVLALWRQGLLALDAVHAHGLCVGHAFAHAMVRCPDGVIGFTDLRDAPAAELPLVQGQARDALAYLFSTAGLLHLAGAREAARAPWTEWLAQPVRDDAFRAVVQQAVTRLTWLRYLPPDARWGRDAWCLRAAWEQAISLHYE